MNDLSQQLLATIDAQDVRQVKTLLARGANPNAIDDHDDSALMSARDSWNDQETRFQMAAALHLIWAGDKAGRWSGIGC